VLRPLEFQQVSHREQDCRYRGPRQDQAAMGIAASEPANNIRLKTEAEDQQTEPREKVQIEEHYLSL